MSPHVLICLAVVLFAGMVQVKASDANDCYNERFMHEVFGEPLSAECAAEESAPAAPAGGEFTNFDDLLGDGFSFEKKK